MRSILNWLLLIALVALFLDSTKAQGLYNMSNQPEMPGSLFLENSAFLDRSLYSLRPVKQCWSPIHFALVLYDNKVGDLSGLLSQLRRYGILATFVFEQSPLRDSVPPEVERRVVMCLKDGHAVSFSLGVLNDDEVVEPHQVASILDKIGSVVRNSTTSLIFPSFHNKFVSTGTRRLYRYLYSQLIKRRVLFYVENALDTHHWGDGTRGTVAERHVSVELMLSRAYADSRRWGFPYFCHSMHAFSLAKIYKFIRSGNFIPVSVNECIGELVQDSAIRVKSFLNPDLKL